MARGPSKKLKPFQKLMLVMASGKPVSVSEIDTLLGKEIYMYRLSTYIWHIKSNAGVVVRAIKDGRKVTAYQIVNVDEAKKYLDRVGASGANFTPGSVEKKPSVAKVAAVKASKTPAKAKAPVAKTKAPDVKKAAKAQSKPVEVMEITEVA
jgi:ArsR family metal-binding transcriptional regulator